MRITEGDADDIEHRLIGLAALLSGDNGSSRERSHSNRKQLFKLVRKVILRHACVKVKDLECQLSIHCSHGHLVTLNWRTVFARFA